MITLDANSRLTRWFVWCCDHFGPFATTRLYRDENDHEGVQKTGAYYVANGTTLCHLFWAMLWMPLLGALGVAFLLLMIVGWHVEAYREAGDRLGVVAVFIPEGILLAVAVTIAVILFAIIGGTKSGVFPLLWKYLKGIKGRVCPLVRFGREQS